MEEIVQAGLTLTALSGLVYTVTSSVYRVLPMSKLGEYTKMVKLFGAFMVALGFTIGFNIDLSQSIVLAEPVTPMIGFVITSIFAAIGSAGVFTVTKRVM